MPAVKNVNYGDAFHLKVGGYNSDTGTTGYLSLNESGAVTTLDPETTWKFESPIGKAGVVEVLDIVNIVYAGPSPKYQSCYLQGAADAITHSITAVADDGKSDKNLLKWEIALQTYAILGDVTDAQYIMLSCCSNPTQITGVSAIGAFLVAQGSDYGNKVGTRKVGDVHIGAETWWLPCGITPSPSPSPSPSPNPLCGDLPTIMQSVCSLIVLMNKVVDACYPQSSWPTTSYPTGCNDCGCKDKD